MLAGSDAAPSHHHLEGAARISMSLMSYLVISGKQPTDPGCGHIHKDEWKPAITKLTSETIRMRSRTASTASSILFKSTYCNPSEKQTQDVDLQAWRNEGPGFDRQQCDAEDLAVPLHLI